jgi:hypothetical protein
LNVDVRYVLGVGEKILQRNEWGIGGVGSLSLPIFVGNPGTELLPFLEK